MHTVIEEIIKVLCYRHYLVHFSGLSFVLLPQHINFSHINALCWVVSNIWLGFTIGETVSAVLMQALPHWRVSLVSILRAHMPGLSPVSSWVQSQVEQRAGQWHLYQNKAGRFLSRGWSPRLELILILILLFQKFYMHKNIYETLKENE